MLSIAGSSSTVLFSSLDSFTSALFSSAGVSSGVAVGSVTSSFSPSSVCWGCDSPSPSVAGVSVTSGVGVVSSVGVDVSSALTVGSSLGCCSFT